jgi:hypothetical protein
MSNETTVESELSAKFNLEPQVISGKTSDGTYRAVLLSPKKQSKPSDAKIILMDTVDKFHPYGIPFRRAIIKDESLLVGARKVLESFGYTSPFLASAKYFQIRDDF